MLVSRLESTLEPRYYPSDSDTSVAAIFGLESTLCQYPRCFVDDSVAALADGLVVHALLAADKIYYLRMCFTSC